MISVAPFGVIQDDVRSDSSQLRVDEKLRVIQFVFGNYINGLSVCAKKEMYLLYGQFNNRYRYAHDVERWLRFFKYQKPSFIEGTAQSYSRLGTGSTANADLLGHLDVLKFLWNSLQSYGLRGFVPDAMDDASLSLEQLTMLFAKLFDRRNLFFQFDMCNPLLELVALSLQKETLLHHIPGLISIFGTRADDAADQLVTAQLEAINEIVKQPNSIATISFAEHIARLKNTVVSDDVRNVLVRFLNQGF